MRRLRLTVLLAAAATLVLAGCTDPSPDSPTAEQTSASDSPSADATTEPTDGSTAVEDSQPPTFGTATNPGGGGSVCLDDGDAMEATLSTVLTAVTPITIDSVTLAPSAPDVEILDQFVLPYDGGLGGLTFGDYPPDDREGEREDAVGHALAAGETITIGVGFSIAENPGPAELTLGITYTAAGSGDTEELESSYQLILADDCNPDLG